ncbi:MAG: FG-GAP repeat protein [Ignavibacteria bacterium]|nr:FG-GAP repeat protein [Ignavibacteria bacterium]
MNNSPDVTLTGEAQYDIFAVSVSTAGDVNGDGFSDVIIGSPK